MYIGCSVLWTKSDNKEIYLLVDLQFLTIGTVESHKGWWPRSRMRRNTSFMWCCFGPPMRWRLLISMRREMIILWSPRNASSMWSRLRCIVCWSMFFSVTVCILEKNNTYPWYHHHHCSKLRNCLPIFDATCLLYGGYIYISYITIIHLLLQN